MDVEWTEEQVTRNEDDQHKIQGFAAKKDDDADVEAIAVVNADGFDAKYINKTGIPLLMSCC